MEILFLDGYFASHYLPKSLFLHQVCVCFHTCQISKYQEEMSKHKNVMVNIHAEVGNVHYKNLKYF